MNNQRRMAAIVAALSLGLISIPVATSQTTQGTLPFVSLYVGMHKLQAEVALTPEQRAIGLMGRKSMPDNAGMLFIFEQPSQQCFWMKNTLIPLSIAFINDDGTIANIADMQPLSLDSHCSSQPVRFALEVNQGWFQQRNLTAGSRVTGIPTTRVNTAQ